MLRLLSAISTCRETSSLLHISPIKKVVLIVSSLEGDWVRWVTSNEIVKWRQMIENIDLREIVVGYLVSLILSTAKEWSVLILIYWLISLIFIKFQLNLFRGRCLALCRCKCGLQRSQLGHFLWQRPWRGTLDKRRDGRDGGVSLRHLFRWLNWQFLLVTLIWSLENCRWALILIWFIRMDTWTSWRLSFSRRRLFNLRLGGLFFNWYEFPVLRDRQSNLAGALAWNSVGLGRVYLLAVLDLSMVGLSSRRIWFFGTLVELWMRLLTLQLWVCVSVWVWLIHFYDCDEI